MKHRRLALVLLLTILLIVNLPEHSKCNELIKDTQPPNPTFYYCDCCGLVMNAFVEDMPSDNTRSGLAKIQLNTDSSFNFSFSYKGNLPTGIKLPWYAQVTDLTKDAKLVVTFGDVAGNDTTITLIYIPYKIVVRPSLDFGLHAKGDTVYKDTWIVNKTITNFTSPYKLDSVRLKFRDQCFDILDYSPPAVISTKDSIKIKIRFIDTMDGEFLDSIGEGNECDFGFKAQVKAKVGMPLIDVSDYDFGDVPVNQIAQGTIHIKNQGSVPLIITNFTHPNLTVFADELRAINPQNPLILNPGQYYDFSVDFIPTDTLHYTDTMFFMSNSAITPATDSIAILNGRGISSELIANSYDWGQKIINIPPDFPAGPYDALEPIIVIRNNGTQSVTIRGIKRVADTNGTAFLFSEPALTNVIIIPGDSLYVPVQFQPTVLGLNKLVLGYDNTAVSSTQTVLQGIGIIPDDVKDNYNHNEKFTISPNPASSAFTLKFESANNAKMQVTLFDLLGNTVFSASEESNIGINEKVIDCRGLETGYYIVRIMLNGVVEMKAVLLITN